MASLNMDGTETVPKMLPKPDSKPPQLLHKSNSKQDLLSKPDSKPKISPKPNLNPYFKEQNEKVSKPQPNLETQQKLEPKLETQQDPSKPQTNPKKFFTYLVVRNVRKDTFDADAYFSQLFNDMCLQLGTIISCGNDVVVKCNFRSYKDASVANKKCRKKNVSLFFQNRLPQKYVNVVKRFDSCEDSNERFCKKEENNDNPQRENRNKEYKEITSRTTDSSKGGSRTKQGRVDLSQAENRRNQGRVDLKRRDNKIQGQKGDIGEGRKREDSYSSTDGQGNAAPEGQGTAAPDSQRDFRDPMKKFLSCVYIMIEGVVKESLIEGFLRTRGAIPLEANFKLTSFKVDDEKSITCATLKFKTKAEAMTAIETMKRSNINSDTEIKASLTSVDDTIEARKVNLGSMLGQIGSQYENMLTTHREKIKNVKAKIDENLKSKPVNISFADYQRLEDEKLALESKLTELYSQEEEYIAYVTGIKERLQESVNSENFRAMSNEELKNFGIENCRLEANLPMYGRRRKILQVIQDNQVVVIRGETGSGKSTQLVQFLYQAGYGQKGIICCSQPRKVACLSLAERVAQELASAVGQIVGYKSGAKRQFNDSTKIMYQTHHSLLNICLKDPKLEKYSCLIIDEAHERSIFTDLLISIVKTCLPVRPDLKVIISSATIEVGVFSEYFNQCPVLEISGRAFPVEVIWREPEKEHEDFNHFERRSVEMAIKLHETEGQGDILVFLTCPQETEKCKEDLDRKLETRRSRNYRCFVFHGQMPPEDQKEVFSQLPEGQRKIIFATNTAETSITITGVKYVIDSGLAKERLFDPVRNINTLRIQIISQSAAEQRKGRAGRTAPGVCYRLYTRKSFEAMRPTTIPEIQKIHLGQGLLMLFEMGIDPTTCEFVEPPCEEAMLSALKTLEDLGCIREKTITDLGKFLAKIPLEPRLSVMVKLGYDQGILYDSIVFAVLHSYSSNLIFYRNGSDQEKKQSDTLKLRFCDKKGDGLTFLNVYKEWMTKADNRKNRWCFENKINSKSLRAARETITEIITVLRKEFKINVKENLTSGKERDEKLQKMALYGFFDNVCYNMGRPRYAYFSSELNQRVYVHPGSALSSLNDSSPWLVFGSFLRTSKDFITTLTPVEVTWIQEIRHQRMISRDIVKEAEEKKLINTHTEGLGPVTMREFIGVKYTNLRQYEDELSQDIQTPVVLEVDRDLGEIRLFSTLDNLETVERFKEMIKKVKDSIASKSIEYSLGTKSRDAGVRIVLGRGGEGQLVLMKNEHRAVFITKPNIHDTSFDRIMKKFSVFGEIVDVFVESRVKNRWGTLTFAKPKDATKAVRGTKDDQFEVAEPVIHLKNNTEFQFNAHMRWCRRPSTGLGFCDVSPLILAKATRLRHIQVNGNPVDISLNKKSENSLVFHKIPPNAGFEDVRDSLCNSLQLYDEESRQNVKRINIVREKVNTTKHDLANIKTRIEDMIIGCGVPKINFEVIVNEPRKQTDFEFEALLKFSELREGKRVCRLLDNRGTINDQVVKVIPNLCSTIIVPKLIYDMTKKAIDKAIEFHIDNAINPIDFQLTDKQLSHGRVSLRLVCSKAEELAKIREAVAMELKGDVLECWQNENYHLLFLENGRKFLQQVGTNTNTHIAADERKFTLSFYGDEGDITRAKIEINNFIGDHLEGRCREIQLNGQNQPSGLMKELVKTYGLNLEGLIEETEVTSVLLNHSTQHLKITGPPKSVDKAFGKISFVAQKLKKKAPDSSPEKSLPECVICMMEVEGTSKFQRLEYCGHVYCLDCLHQQLNVDIQNKKLPVVCGEADCNEPFLWQDFVNCFSKMKNLDETRLVTAAVDKYVMDNSTSYKHCLTPDCPLIYRVTSHGKASVCRECRVRFCTQCHVVFHEGLTCYQYKNGITSGETELEKFLQENPDMVKKCPKCSTLIEKTYGCHHITCKSCKIHFCWLCLEYFSTSRQCYDHMSKAHGNFGL